MQSLEGYTARRINILLNRKGNFWQAQYHDHAIRKDEVLEKAVLYCLNNPVRAGIVERAEDFFWSSAKAHVYGEDDELLSDFQLTSEIPDWASYLRKKTSESETKLFRSHAQNGLPLGGNEFVDNLERMLGRKLRKKKPGPRSK